MKLVWTKHLKTQEEKEQFQKLLLGNKQILKVLKKILDEKDLSLERSENTLESYNTPSWAFKQAHKNGYRSCLEAIKDLINLDQKENN